MQYSVSQNQNGGIIEVQIQLSPPEDRKHTHLLMLATSLDTTKIVGSEVEGALSMAVTNELVVVPNKATG